MYIILRIILLFQTISELWVDVGNSVVHIIAEWRRDRGNER